MTYIILVTERHIYIYIYIYINDLYHSSNRTAHNNLVKSIYKVFSHFNFALEEF